MLFINDAEPQRESGTSTVPMDYTIRERPWASLRRWEGSCPSVFVLS
jgi:hypothetical protein